MKNQLMISLSRFRHISLSVLLFIFFFMVSGVSGSAQGYYKKRSDRSKGSKSKVKWKKNIVWLEGLGSNQVVGVKYERIFHFGAVVSMRFDVGLTPFVVDERYNFIVGRSITPITGMGFYFHFVPLPVRLGLGCSVLHDIYFNGIPETMPDTTGGPPPNYAVSNYKARVMPFAVLEATIKDRWTVRAGYSPIIDPPNHAQTEIYMTHWVTLGVGYKFGN